MQLGHINLTCSQCCGSETIWVLDLDLRQNVSYSYGVGSTTASWRYTDLYCGIYNLKHVEADPKRGLQELRRYCSSITYPLLGPIFTKKGEKKYEAFIYTQFFCYLQYKFKLIIKYGYFNIFDKFIYIGTYPVPACMKILSV
jgi:hypothetical protein